MLTLTPSTIARTATQQAVALSAPVGDPLWMLARQWQTGGFIADDAGTPIHAELGLTTSPVLLDGTPVTDPIEPLIEAEPAPHPHQLDTASRARMATELFRILRDRGTPVDQIGRIRAVLAQKYPLHPVAADSDLLPFYRRLPDATTLCLTLAEKLHPDGTGDYQPPADFDPADQPAAETATRAWFAWMSARTSIITGQQPTRWMPDTLGYQARLTATLPSNSAVTLTAADYDGTGLDWHHFDRSILPATEQPTAATTSTPVRPTTVTFPGMPEPRFWALEDGTVNLDTLITQDPARALLTTFAHSYSNDWFVIPVDPTDDTDDTTGVTAGITLVANLTVTDTFGTATTIQDSAAADGPAGRFRLWELTPDTDQPGDKATGLRLFLPAGPAPLQGQPIEDVLIARDEIANLAWQIELATSDEDGAVVDRQRRWLRQRTATDPVFNPLEHAQLISYRLGTTLPPHWYPLSQGLDTAGGPSDPPTLQQATLPTGAVDGPQDVLTGSLIPHVTGTRLADQAASRTGTRLTRTHRLAYTTTGPRTWQARSRQPGTGEATSGLRFDVLGEPDIQPNLVNNPDFAQVRREPPAGLFGKSPAATGSGLSAAEHWTLWNNDDAATTTRVEPTTRPAGTVGMLRVSTNRPGCGLVQQWASTGTGPAAATAAAWVFVIRGTVMMGSGNGGNIGLDAASAHTNRWELLEAPSGRSPVNEVIIYASDPAGAEYLVDHVSVRAT